jgi:tetratricopeptide (TPR) repeat protein
LFEEAAKMESDNTVKAEDYYAISVLLYDQKNYSKARQYCIKAIDFNPNYGLPYILIGHMYVATASGIYPDDPVLKKTVYYAAVDKFEKARQVDSSVSDEASKWISTYRQHFPTSEEIFMHPDLNKRGNAFTVGGWIGERTIIR